MRNEQQKSHIYYDYSSIYPNTDGSMPMDIGINIDRSLNTTSNYLTSNLKWAWKVFKNHDWDHKYKDYDYFYDIWSNIHYGFIGRVAGFTENELFRGADAAQNIDNKTEGGDTPDDKTSIQIGLSLYNKFKDNIDNLTAQDLLDMIEAASYKDQSTKEPHWCWNERNTKQKKRKK